jgi:hypothetical protein
LSLAAVVGAVLVDGTGRAMFIIAVGLFSMLALAGAYGPYLGGKQSSD